ncbi:MAG: MATE family efflux transporter [Dysgonamonadaceae bacterium]|jgi:putative MATE family efflux protein|nr:MATE family efflux transporter [Dysgonamonadaceae bacterium]
MKNSIPLELGTDNVGKLLMRYAMPAIIAMTAASLYNITDSIFIGHGVGPVALTGLGITFPLMNLTAAFGSLIGVGASTLLSIRLGQKDYGTANSILGNVFSMNIIMGVGISAISIPFLNPILHFFGASNATYPYAYDFMLIIMVGNVFTHLYFGLNAMLRSAGFPMKSMMATIYSVIINLILNPLFIFVFEWGIKGSAFATIISQIIVLGWQIYLFNNKSPMISLKKGIFKLKKRIVIDSISIGMAPFLMNAAACLIVILINKQLLKHGNDFAVGAYTVINRLAFFFVMVVIGLNQGMQPIAGYNFGAKLYGRVTEVLKKSVLYATIIMIAGFTVVEMFPKFVASLFTSEKELISIASHGLRWVFACYPLIGFQMVVSAFFQSIGKAAKSIVLSMVRQVLILIPLLFILPEVLGITGVWVSIAVSDFISVIIAAGLITMEVKQLKKLK